MDSNNNIEYEEYEFLYSWKKVEQILRERRNKRLPNAIEAVYINFKHDAIWVSEEINNKHCVMDVQYGIQVARDGKYGLVLLEKDNDKTT